ncbi:MAG: hypothetical protein HY332_19040 [Chloroflexi bacterium]|nr:hypothetical protein [Chloroflexota bacterium]
MGTGGLADMLTDYLQAQQARMRLSHQQFAAYIGVDPDNWPALHDGEFPFTATIVARLLLRFPKAHPLVLQEWRRRDRLQRPIQILPAPGHMNNTTKPVTVPITARPSRTAATAGAPARNPEPAPTLPMAA